MLGNAVALNDSGAGVSEIITQWIWKSSEEDRGYHTRPAISCAQRCRARLLRWQSD